GVLAAALGGAALFASDARLAAENALLWLPPAFVVAGLFVVAAPARPLLVFAAPQLAQMFPRPDLIHPAQIGPCLLVAGAVVWRTFAAAWWRRVPDPRRARRAARLVFAGVLLLAAARLGPGRLALQVAPLRPLPGAERADLVIAEDFASGFGWLGELTGEIGR